jgi:hypothetical protein
MAKYLHDDVLDGALNVIKNNATKLCICSTQPTTYTEATTTYKLAIKTGLTSADYTGPADHTSGRKLTVNAQSTISVDFAGTAEHVAVTGTSSVLYAVTTCTSQALSLGNTVSVPAWIISMGDPT